MHVVHVYDGHEKVHGGRGSVPGVVWNVARETAKAGHDVTVVERQWDGLAVTAEHDGVCFRRLSLSTGADEPWSRVPYEMVRSPVGLARLVGDRTNFALRALRVLRDLDYDVLHVHLPFAANVITTVAPWLRDRIVYTAHLGELRLNAIDDGSEAGVSVPAVLQFLSPDRVLARRVARTTVLNPSIRDAFLDASVPRSRLVVVPNGVDVRRFESPPADVVERVREKYGLTGRRTVLFVGTVMPRKGVDDLVRAVAMVVNGTPESPVGSGRGHPPVRADSDRPDIDTDGGRRDVKLVIAGDTDLDTAYAERVDRTVRNTGLEDSVEVTGFVPERELPALYALADVFALPSREEGFGMTVVEAMAAGTPVVATTVGDVPRIVEPDRHGVLVEPGDIEAFAAGLDRLLTDDAEREWMGEQARQRADSYSWHSIAEQFTAVYGGVA